MLIGAPPSGTVAAERLEQAPAELLEPGLAVEVLLVGAQWRPRLRATGRTARRPIRGPYLSPFPSTIPCPETPVSAEPTVAADRAARSRPRRVPRSLRAAPHLNRVVRPGNLEGPLGTSQVRMAPAGA